MSEIESLKRKIIEERVGWSWVFLFVSLIMADYFLYVNNIDLSKNEGSTFWQWIEKVCEPHNWLFIITVVLVLFGIRFIWDYFKKKYFFIEDFWFVPVFIIVAAILYCIGLNF